jgi:hypothetical protein
LKTTLLQIECQHHAGALDMSMHGAKIKTFTLIYTEIGGVGIRRPALPLLAFWREPQAARHRFR